MKNLHCKTKFEVSFEKITNPDWLSALKLEQAPVNHCGFRNLNLGHKPLYKLGWIQGNWIKKWTLMDQLLFIMYVLCLIM